MSTEPVIVRFVDLKTAQANLDAVAKVSRDLYGKYEEARETCDNLKTLADNLSVELEEAEHVLQNIDDQLKQAINARQKAFDDDECSRTLQSLRRFIKENLSTIDVIVATTDQNGRATKVGLVTRTPGGYGYLDHTTDGEKGVVKLVAPDTYQRYLGDCDATSGDLWYVVNNAVQGT